MEIETYRREMAHQALRAPHVEACGEARFRTTAPDAAIAAERMWRAVVRAHDQAAGFLQ